MLLMEELINSTQGIDKTNNNDAQSSEKFNFALNAAFEDFSDNPSFPFKSSFPSNLLASKLEVGEQIISVKVINELQIVLLFTRKGAYSLIKYFKIKSKEQYKLTLQEKGIEEIIQDPFIEIKNLIVSKGLNFRLQNPIHCEYKITETTFNLYFVDGYNEDRFIYFDYDKDYDLTVNESFKKRKGNTIINLLDINKIKWNTHVDYPSLELNVIDGGVKEKGNYSYMIAYSTEKGIPLTSYKNLTTGINVFSEKEKTNKGVRITVSNIHQSSRYTHYSIVGIKTTNGQTSYYNVGTFQISQKEVNDLDDSNLQIDLNSILVEYPIYKNSNFITVGNDILFRGKINEYEKFNLQKVVNNIHLQWIKVKLKEGDYKDPIVANKYRSYLSDENYIFGIKFILDNLQETPVFIIPGRSKNTHGCVDATIINNEDSNNVDLEKHLVYNTAKINNNYTVDYDKESPNIIMDGEFGYYESVEKYPNIPSVWGDLADTPIKLHKFPDIVVSGIHSSSSNYNDSCFIYPLGVKIADDVDLNGLLNIAVDENLITKEQKNRIQGYKLVRGNRVGNKSIIAKGLLFNVWQATEDSEEDCAINQTTYFPSYPFNDENPDLLLSSTKSHYDYKNFQINNQTTTPLEFVNTGRYTFHSPDTHFVEPSIGNVLKIESNEYGVSKGFFNNSEEQAKYKILTKKHYHVAILIGQWLGINIQDPSVEQLSAASNSMGSSIGQTVGGFVGLGQVGSALGGLVGGLVGKSLGENTFSHLLFKNSVILSEADKILQLFNYLAQERNIHKQYQAVGKYNTSIPISNSGIKIRKIDNSAYLNSGRISIAENTSSVLFNNWNRESSVYLKLNSNLPSTPIEDTSRLKINQNVSLPQEVFSEDCFNWHIVVSNNSNPRFSLKMIACDGYEYAIPGGVVKDSSLDITVCAKAILVDEYPGVFAERSIKLGDLVFTKGTSCGAGTLVGYEKEDCKCSSEERTGVVSNFYGSIKNNILNQYGNIYDVQWLEIDSSIKSIYKIQNKDKIDLLEINLTTVPPGNNLNCSTTDIVY